MEGRPRQFAITIDGVPGAKMWSDDMGQASAARRLVRTVAADQTDSLRLYVAAPRGTGPQQLGFTMTALDAEGGTVRYASRFDAPGEEAEHDEASEHRQERESKE